MPTATTVRMAVAAVIFDLDGVLVDSAEAHHQSWRALAAELGQDVTAEQFASSFGRQNRDIIPLLFGGGDDHARIHRLSHRKETLYRDMVRGRVPAMPGAADLVHGCRRAGLRLAIGSSAPVDNIELVLGEMGIADCFESIVHDGDVSRGKPDPGVFVLAAQRLGVGPEECVVVEDAPSGIQAACAAGMKAIGLTTHHDRQRLGQADLVVDSLGELTPERIKSV
jgi:beta-phosphoglucomutase family hydrolase